MAKQTQPKGDLVILSLGYWNKFIMPVDAATAIMTTLVKSGAVKVEEHMNTYMPQPHDAAIQLLDRQFIDDAPTTGKAKEDYRAWLKTKQALIGTEYQPENFATYLATKQEAEA